MKRRQKIWLCVVVVTNAVLWAIPSNVVENIARDNHTMLGRYSRQHFAWIIAVGLISIVSFYIDWSTGERYKRRWFQVLAVVLFGFPALAGVDFVLRAPERAHYVRKSLAYHRPPNETFEITFEDRPRAARTYPNAPAGYGTVPIVGRTDAHGFRNREAAEQYDAVAIGDSFTEGSNVSDEHPWPVRLAGRTGLRVYNLGMSGYDPIHYAAALEDFGLSLSRRYVVCMLYEGNDFRSAQGDLLTREPSLSRRFKHYVKQSPLLNMLDRLLIETFGPIRAEAPVPRAEILDWMPVAIRGGSDARYYAFEPKQLRDIYRSDDFATNRHWRNSRRLLSRMAARCSDAGVELVVTVAPTKAHVVMPLAADALPADHVRAFLALRYDEPLPSPERFMEVLMGRVGRRQRVVEEWCRRAGIAFVDVTEPLRTATARGIQTYYTYDQHWTPEGHAVVAEAVAEYFARRSSAAAEEHAAR